MASYAARLRTGGSAARGYQNTKLEIWTRQTHIPLGPRSVPFEAVAYHMSIRDLVRGSTSGFLGHRFSYSI